jgi:hypothetical protein
MPGPGLGLQAFGFGPYGVVGGDPDDPRTVLSSSRLIDTVTRAYVRDEYGNPEPMDDVAQRVYIALSYADTTLDVITPRGLREQKAKIEQALAGMINESPPAIRNVVVTIVGDSKGRTLKTVSYQNALTGTKTSLRIR